MSANKQVADFHRTFGAPVAESLTAATPELRVLRVKLLMEEVLELAAALGVEICCSIDNVQDELSDENVTFRINHEVRPDLVETADALGDINYVTYGAALVFGIPLDEVVDEIHRSNMSKLGSDGKPVMREDGKVLKGPFYFKPNIARVLADNNPIKL